MMGVQLNGHVSYIIELISSIFFILSGNMLCYGFGNAIIF